MDAMVDLQRETLDAQENLLDEVKESRKDVHENNNYSISSNAAAICRDGHCRR